MKSVLLLTFILLISSCKEEVKIVENVEVVKLEASRGQNLEEKNDEELVQLSKDLMNSVLEAEPCSDSGSVCLDQLKIQELQLKRQAKALQILIERNAYSEFTASQMQENRELLAKVEKLIEEFLENNNPEITRAELAIADLFDDLYDQSDRVCDLETWTCRSFSFDSLDDVDYIELYLQTLSSLEYIFQLPKYRKEISHGGRVLTLTDFKKLQSLFYAQVEQYAKPEEILLDKKLKEALSEKYNGIGEGFQATVIRNSFLEVFHSQLRTVYSRYNKVEYITDEVIDLMVNYPTVTDKPVKGVLFVSLSKEPIAYLDGYLLIDYELLLSEGGPQDE